MLEPGDILAARCLMVPDNDTGNPVMQVSAVMNCQVIFVSALSPYFGQGLGLGPGLDN